VSKKGWIGVDLAGTLALYDGWKGIAHIGRPIPAMVARVRLWLAEGEDVRIFTARVSHRGDTAEARRHIQDWCERHFNRRLRVTCRKDYNTREIWDDRAVQVVKNTGRKVEAP
jgi:hypothetical protein